MSQDHPHVNYLYIFIALCVCTALSVLFDIVNIESKAVVGVLVLAVATVKALFVLTFFMHLKFEGRWKYLLLAPTTVLAVGLPLAMLPDIGMHYYVVVTPQQALYAAEHPELENDEGTANQQQGHSPHKKH